jgi:hypothetical protein
VGERARRRSTMARQRSGQGNHSSARFGADQGRGARDVATQELLVRVWGTSWHGQLRRINDTRPCRQRRMARGARPHGPPPPEHGAWPTGLRSPPGLRGPVRISRGVRTPEGADGDAWQAVQAHAPDARARRHQRPSPILFGLRLFKNVELTFLVRNLKISKNESCRATIGLQLSHDQRFARERRPKLQFFHGSNYCSQRSQTDFWPICTPNWNVRQLRKMCSRK